MHAKEKKSEIRHFGTNKGCFTRKVLTRGLEVPITLKKKKKKTVKKKNHSFMRIIVQFIDK